MFKSNKISAYIFLSIFILFLFVYLILSNILLPYSSIDNVYNIKNNTKQLLRVKFIAIDIYDLNDNNNIVQEKTITIGANGKDIINLPQYEDQKSNYSFMQIIKDNEVLLTYSIPINFFKRDILIIRDDPIRIEIEKL